MAYDFVPEPGEESLASVSYQAANHSEPFICVVTNGAVHVSRSTLLNGRHLHRIPLQQLTGVRIRRVRPTIAWLVGLVLFAVGVVTTFLMFADPVMVEGTNLMKVWGAPMGLVVVGLVMPVAARGRFALYLEAGPESRRWKPSIVLGQKARTEVRETMLCIVNAARELGVAVSVPPQFA